MLEDIPTYIGVAVAIIVVIFVLKNGLKTIRPTHLGAIETFGKYTAYKEAGLVLVIPFMQHLRTVNTTERLVDVEKQDVITKENLNCKVDAQVYYKIMRTEAGLKGALYNVDHVDHQIVELAQSTLRNVIGKKMFKEVNAKRGELNTDIFSELEKQTEPWGVHIVRVELKEIYPPADVQQTMNEIIKAENEKDKQEDLAKAKVIDADGNKKRDIIDAEADKQQAILQAEGKKERQRIEAEGEKNMIVLQAQADKERQELVASGESFAIKAVADANAHKTKVEQDAIQEHFIENAITFKQLDTDLGKFQHNSKIITDGKTPLTLIENETKDKVIPTNVGGDKSGKGGDDSPSSSSSPDRTRTREHYDPNKSTKSKVVTRGGKAYQLSDDPNYDGDYVIGGNSGSIPRSIRSTLSVEERIAEIRKRQNMEQLGYGKYR